jgi:hypothetical protein
MFMCINMELAMVINKFQSLSMVPYENGLVFCECYS